MSYIKGHMDSKCTGQQMEFNHIKVFVSPNKTDMFKLNIIIIYKTLTCHLKFHCCICRWRKNPIWSNTFGGVMLISRQNRVNGDVFSQSAQMKVASGLISRICWRTCCFGGKHFATRVASYVLLSSVFATFDMFINKHNWD